MHDEVISTVGADWESVHVVGVELAGRSYPEIEFFGLDGGVRCCWRHCFGQCCSLGELNALSRLFYVTLEGFYGDMEVLGCVGGGDACPGGVVTYLGGCQTGLFNWGD